MPGSSSQGIFLSYRRDDTAVYARLLKDRLTERFPAAQIFMDLDSIQVGRDFVEAIEEALGSCAVLVALIGRQWATLTGEDGRRRLDDPADTLRFEVKTALDRGVPVIPVLVDGADAPRQQELPAELHKLARLNALEWSLSRHQYDTDRLLDLIQQELGGTRLFNEQATAITAQLGDAQPAARLAGVHAMAALADDWEQNRQTCVDVLCAYLRLPYELDPGDEAPEPQRLAFRASREVRHTVIRVITAHLQADAAVSWQGLNFDFTGVVFDGGDFNGARFSGGTVSFVHARFSCGTVDFTRAGFSGGRVSFDHAEFSGGEVSFSKARFSGGEVSFRYAKFSDGEVHLGRAGFSGGTVDFSDAGS